MDDTTSAALGSENEGELAQVAPTTDLLVVVVVIIGAAAATFMAEEEIADMDLVEVAVEKEAEVEDEEGTPPMAAKVDREGVNA